MTFFLKRHLPWVSSVAIGALLVSVGIVFMVMGNNTRNEITKQLRDEQVTTSADSSIPGVLVESEETARAQADAIKNHTLGTWGPYSQLPKDDPRRVQFIDGVALRTALNMSVMGYEVTNLVIAGGAIILIAGLATMLLASPALYMLAGVVVSRQTVNKDQKHG